MRQNGSAGKLDFLIHRAWSVVRRPRVIRDNANVVQEYSEGWRRYRACLEGARTLDEWLRIQGIEDQPGWRNVEGRLRYGAFDSVSYYRETVLAALVKYFPEARSLTEFGCGVGRNLLYLKRKLPEWDTQGYELCVPGVEVGEAAAKKFGMSVRYAQLDYLNDPPSKYVLPVTDVGFTLFSLEQVPRENARALRNILQHVRMGSIHVEPVPENYPLSLRGLLGRIDHWKVDYLSGFDKAVRGLGLQEVHLERLGSAHNPLMFPSLYVLRKA